MTTKMKLWVFYHYIMLFWVVAGAGFNAWLYYRDQNLWTLLSFAINVFLIPVWWHWIKPLKEKNTCFQPSCSNWRASPSGLFCKQHNTDTYFYERWYQDE